MLAPFDAVLLDVVMNHIGPVTPEDPVWPADWVRLDPVCTHKDTASTVDCALVPNAAGGISPPTAQFAVAQARALARNIVAAVTGRQTQAFSHRSRGMMAATGHLKGVAQVFGLRLTGLPAARHGPSCHGPRASSPGRRDEP